MYPVLFRVFGIQIHSYGVMLLIAFFVAVWLARKRAPRFGFTPDQVYDASFWALILGIIGARLFFIVQEWPYYSKHTAELFSWQFAGLTSFGGLVMGAVGLFLWSRHAKKSFIRMLDVIAAPFLIAHAIGRIGCLLNGCCYGGQCDLPWGIHVRNDGGVLLPGLYHPAQIYDGLMNVAAFILLLYIERRGLVYGRSISLVLILHGTARFIYEFWRAGTVAQVNAGVATSTYMGKLPITDAQVAALAVIAIGAVMFLILPQRDVSRRRVAALEA